MIISLLVVLVLSLTHSFSFSLVHSPAFSPFLSLPRLSPLFQSLTYLSSSLYVTRSLCLRLSPLFSNFSHSLIFFLSRSLSYFLSVSVSSPSLTLSSSLLSILLPVSPSLCLRFSPLFSNFSHSFSFSLARSPTFSPFLPLSLRRSVSGSHLSFPVSLTHYFFSRSLA